MWGFRRRVWEGAGWEGGGFEPLHRDGSIPAALPKVTLAGDRGWAKLRGWKQKTGSVPGTVAPQALEYLLISALELFYSDRGASAQGDSVAGVSSLQQACSAPPLPLYTLKFFP